MVMELTGKCKEEFEKWVNSQDDQDIHHFEMSSNSMKFGVLVDYFDSVGGFIEVYYNYADGDITWKYTVNEHFKENSVSSRGKARVKAITEANSIRNKQLNK